MRLPPGLGLFYRANDSEAPLNLVGGVVGVLSFKFWTYLPLFNDVPYHAFDFGKILKFAYKFLWLQYSS